MVEYSQGTEFSLSLLKIQRWFFLPRHLSKLHFDAENVHTTGANVLISATEDFSNISHVYIGKANTSRGFSAFQFVPGKKVWIDFNLNIRHERSTDRGTENSRISWRRGEFVHHGL